MPPVIEEAFEQEQTLDDLEKTFQLPPESSAPPPAPVDPEQQQMQLYGITTAYIEELRGKCSSLTCDDPKGYDDTRRMIGLLRTTRTRIEKRRKEYNQEHQEAIRFVNGVAKQLTTFVQNIEDPLKEKKLAVDDAKERAKRAAEEAEANRIEAERQAKIAAEEAQRKAAHEAEQARLKAEADKLAAARAEMEAERKKMDEKLAAERAVAAEQQRVERERLDAERARADAQRKAEQDRMDADRAALQAEQSRLQAEIKKIEDAKREAERIEFQRQAKIKAEREAAEKAERDRIAAEQAAIAKAAADKLEAERRAALMPDVERLKAWEMALRDLTPPMVSSPEAKQVVKLAWHAVGEAVELLNDFQP